MKFLTFTAALAALITDSEAVEFTSSRFRKVTARAVCKVGGGKTDYDWAMYAMPTGKIVIKQT